MGILGKRITVNLGPREGQSGRVMAICDDSRPSWYVELDSGEWVVLSGMAIRFEVAQ